MDCLPILIRLTPTTRPSFVRNPKQKDEKRCRWAAVRTYDLHAVCRQGDACEDDRWDESRKTEEAGEHHDHEHRAGVHPTSQSSPSPSRTNHMQKPQKARRPALPFCSLNRSFV